MLFPGRSRTCRAELEPPPAHGPASVWKGGRRPICRAASPRSDAGRKSRRQALATGSRVPRSVRGARRAIAPMSSCRCRWRRAARSDRRGRAADRAATAPAFRGHSRPRPHRARSAAGSAVMGPGRRCAAAASSAGRTIGSSRANALSRLCAWRAFDAL